MAFRRRPDERGSATLSAPQDLAVISLSAAIDIEGDEKRSLREIDFHPASSD
jgi:hypothetical protein